VPARLEEFLTWHRAYLYGFEKQLQDIESTVTLPYWDWAADAGMSKPPSMTWARRSRSITLCAAGLSSWIDEDAIKALAAGGDVPKPVLDGLERLSARPSVLARGCSPPPA